MRSLNATSAASALKSILDQEKQAIFSADFAALEKIAARKERILNRALKQPDLHRQLAPLFKDLQRNNKLLEAMGRGIKQAQKVLQSRMSDKADFFTYGPKGHRSSL